jgi:hypothetical protein
LFILPPGFRPTQILIFPVAVGETGVSATGIAELFVYPDGFVGLYNPTAPNQEGVFHRRHPVSSGFVSRYLARRFREIDADARVAFHRLDRTARVVGEIWLSPMP